MVAGKIDLNSTRSTAVITKPRRAKPKRRHLKKLLTLIAAATSSATAFLAKHDVSLLPSQTLTLESLLRSASTSLSSLFSYTPLKKPRFLSQKQQRALALSAHCWFHRFLSSATAHYDRRWIDAFRMSKPTFTLLVRLLTPSFQSSMPSINPVYVLGAGLYRLGHGCSYEAVGRRFGIEAKEACRAFFVVCKVVNDKLGHLFELRSDLDRVILGFGWLSLPNCCGVLGVERFRVDGENGSLIAQALVDSEGRFLDVSAGWPSKMRPEIILRKTMLFSGVEDSRELLNGPSYNLGGNEVPQYILGDSSFPLMPWLLTPFVGPDTEEEDNVNSSGIAFNSVHKCAMGLVHTAFGKVKARWQLLSKTWNEETVEFLPFAIVTGCLLHNFLIKCSESFPDEYVESEEELEIFPVYEGYADANGKTLRDVIALHLSRMCCYIRGMLGAMCASIDWVIPLTQTGLADFAPGRAVRDAAHHKRAKYDAKCAALGYDFIPFSSSGELDLGVVALFSHIQQFSMTQEIEAQVAVLMSKFWPNV